MKNQIKWFAKKAVAFFFLSIICWQIWEIERNFNFFPIFKIFSVELFLSERIDPVEMLEKSFASLAEEFREALKESGEELEVKFVSDDKETNENGKIPTIFIVSETTRLGKKEVKKFKSFFFNEKLIDELVDGAIAKIIRDKEWEGDEFWEPDFELIKGDISNEVKERSREISQAKFSIEEYEALRKKFPKISYSKEELEILKVNGGLIALVHPSIHYLPNKFFCEIDPLRKSSTNYKVADDENMNYALSMFAGHFYKKKFVKCWKTSLQLKERRELVILALVFSFLFIHLIREDLGSLLDMEEEKRKIEMTRKFRWWVVGKYLKFFIWPVSKKKLPRIIEKIFQDYNIFQEKEVGKEVKREAGKYWKEVEKARPHLSEDEFRYAQDLFRRASDTNRTLSSQRAAFVELKAAEAQLEEKIRLRQNAVCRTEKPRAINFFFKSSGGADWKDKKDVLLSELEKILPKDAVINFDSWESGELDNLRLVLLQLKDMRQDLRRTFLRQENFRDIIKSTAPFMVAIRIGNKKAIVRMLGTESDHLLSIATDTPVEKKSEPKFKQGIRVTIVGFIRNLVLEKAVRELFGNETPVTFLASDKKERLMALGKSNPESRLILTTAIPHAYVEIFKVNNLKSIHVWNNNSSEEYKKTIIKEVIRKNYTDLFE